jgi:tetratricopeptide (TPR) repeat protein
MRVFYTTLSVCLIVGPLSPPAICAQEVKRAPAPQAEPEAEEDVKPLVTPPAWKSVEVGNFYLRRKKYRAALSRFQEAAKTDPYNPQACLGMGRVYDRLGLKQKALENYRGYLDLLPSAKEAEEAKEVQKAIERLERQHKNARPVSSKRADSGQPSTAPP